MVLYETTFQKYDFKFHLFRRPIEVYNRTFKKKDIKKSIQENKTFDTTSTAKTKPTNVHDRKIGYVTTSKLTLYISLHLSTIAFDSKLNAITSLG
jgi:hypothetical protein